MSESENSLARKPVDTSHVNDALNKPTRAPRATGETGLDKAMQREADRLHPGKRR